MKEFNAAETVVSEIEISYQPKVRPSSLPQIINPEDVYKLFLQTWDKTKIEFVEQFKVRLLNRNKRVLGICTLSTGSGTGTVVDPKLVFAVAIKAQATEIILAHNHPSGNIVPSKADHDLTLKLKTAGEYLDLRVTDHIIVTAEEFYSFASEGVL